MTRSRFWVLLMVFSLFCFPGLAEGRKGVSASLAEKIEGGVVDWKEKVVKVTGTAPLDPGTKMLGRLKAKREALANALGKIEQVVQGVRVSSRGSVGQLMKRQGRIGLRLRALSKGAKIVDERPNEQTGAYEVTVALPLFGEEGLGKAILEEELKETKKSEGEKTATPLPPVEGSYTGIILNAKGITDASGAELEASMSPKVLDEKGDVIYGNFDTVDADQVLAEGIVDYVDTIEAAKERERAGENPLVIQAVGVGPGSFHCDVVVSGGDAEKLQREAAGLLARMKVVIVL